MWNMGDKVLGDTPHVPPSLTESERQKLRVKRLVFARMELMSRLIHYLNHNWDIGADDPETTPTDEKSCIDIEIIKCLQKLEVALYDTRTHSNQSDPQPAAKFDALAHHFNKPRFLEITLAAADPPMKEAIRGTDKTLDLQFPDTVQATGLSETQNELIAVTRLSVLHWVSEKVVNEDSMSKNSISVKGLLDPIKLAGLRGAHIAVGEWLQKVTARNKDRFTRYDRFASQNGQSSFRTIVAERTHSIIQQDERLVAICENWAVDGAFRPSTQATSSAAATSSRG